MFSSRSTVTLFELPAELRAMTPAVLIEPASARLSSIELGNEAAAAQTTASPVLNLIDVPS